MAILPGDPCNIGDPHTTLLPSHFPAARYSEVMESEVIESKKREREIQMQTRQKSLHQSKGNTSVVYKEISALIGWSSTSLAAKRISTHLCQGGLQFEKGSLSQIIMAGLQSCFLKVCEAGRVCL